MDNLRLLRQVLIKRLQRDRASRPLYKYSIIARCGNSV